MNLLSLAAKFYMQCNAYIDILYFSSIDSKNISIMTIFRTHKG